MHSDDASIAPTDTATTPATDIVTSTPVADAATAIVAAPVDTAVTVAAPTAPADVTVADTTASTGNGIVSDPTAGIPVNTVTAAAAVAAPTDTAAPTDVAVATPILDGSTVTDTSNSVTLTSDTAVGTAEAAPADAPTIALTLEERVALLETTNAQLLAALAETSKSTGMLGAQFGGIQQNLGQLVQVINQLAGRVNAMDPNRPILEVTFCQYAPVLTADEKGAVFKMTQHNDTHPEKPGQIDALRLDDTNPADPHYVPVGVSQPLMDYLQGELTAAGIAQETWVWVRLREIKRPTGSEANFQMGVDDSVEPAPVVASNDANGNEEIIDAQLEADIAVDSTPAIDPTSIQADAPISQ